jgi:hypothetical protein
MQISENQLFASMARLNVENDVLKQQLSILSNAIVSFLESDKGIKDKWTALHGELITLPENQDGGKNKGKKAK